MNTTTDQTFGPEEPLHFQVVPPAEPRNRLTVAFRPLLAIPHVLLVGSPTLVGLGAGLYRTGALGAAALAMAVLDWFAILFTGRPLTGLTPWKRFYLDWRARALAYMALLRDEYPPFGAGPDYPARLELKDATGPRDRLTVGLRIILLVPHLIVLTLLLIAWIVTAIVSWFMILITGHMAPELWRFGRDVMRYALRVEAYLLLMHDRFPRFSLADPGDQPSLSFHSQEQPV